MKTKINNYIDLKEFIDQKEMIEIERTDHTQDVENELISICKRHGEVLTADETHKAIKKDTVYLKLESENPKFNKENLPVTLGPNFFNKTIEEAVYGMKTNEEKTITVDGYDVKITVNKILTRKSKDLTDELIELETNGEIKTVEEFRKITLEDFEMMDLYNIVFSKYLPSWRDEYIKLLDIKVDPDEEKDYIKFAKKSFENYAQEENKTLKEIIDEMLNKETKNDEEALKALDNWAKKEFLTYAASVFYCDKNNIKFDDKDYEKLIDQILENDPSITKQKAKETYTKEEFFYQSPLSEFIRDFNEMIVNNKIIS